MSAAPHARLATTLQVFPRTPAYSPSRLGGSLFQIKPPSEQGSTPPRVSLESGLPRPAVGRSAQSPRLSLAQSPHSATRLTTPISRFLTKAPKFVKTTAGPFSFHSWAISLEPRTRQASHPSDSRSRKMLPRPTTTAVDCGAPARVSVVRNAA